MLLPQRILAATFLLSFCFYTGCSSNIETGFEGDITKPLDGIPTGTVPTTGEGPFPTQYCYKSNGEFISNVSVTRGGGKYDWALGGTCIFRPLRDVWAAFNHPSFMRWPEAEGYAAALSAAPAGVQLLWNTHYHLERFPVGDVDWDMAWYHTIMQGSPSNPRQVVINYGKYNGTSYIKRWQGSVLLEFVTPTITSITIKDTLSASTQDSQNCEATVRTLVTNSQSGTPNYVPIDSLPGQTVPVPAPTSSPITPTPEPVTEPTGPPWGPWNPIDPDPCNHIQCVK